MPIVNGKSLFIYMRGSKTLNLLSFLAEVVGGVVDFERAIHAAGYNFEPEIIRNYLARERKQYSKKHRKSYKEFCSAKILIRRLERDGIISVDKKKNIKITKSGLKKYKNSLLYPASPLSYVAQDSSRVVIVAFDVPEKQRNKRDFIRRAFQSIGFKLIQRSVLFGYKKIPEDLLKDLEVIGALVYVQIFEVSKEGTLDVG